MGDLVPKRMPWEPVPTEETLAAPCKRGHFAKRYSDGKCVACSLEQNKRWRNNNPEKSVAILKRSHDKHRAQRLIAAARSRAEKKSLEFDLADHVDYYQAIIDEGKCQLTNLAFGKTGPDAPSLDRIVPEKGYVKDNVRVVLWAVNAGLGDWGVEKYREISHAMHQETANTVKLLQADMQFCVLHSAVLVHSNRPELQILVNVRRGEIVPRNECKFTDGTTLEFQDIGMPQPGAPLMTVKDLLAQVWDIVQTLKLEML